MRWEDLGVLVQSDEHRTAAVCTDPTGAQRLVIAARGWVLVVDPLTEECRQLWWQDGAGDYPFASLASSAGTFWTGAGTQLVEVDPFTLTVRTHHPCDDEEIVGFGLAEGPDGRIWSTTYPHCRLFAVDPATGSVSEGPRLSATESYAGHLVVAQDGWLYCGIGTQSRDLVAVSPVGESRSLAEGFPGGKGSGYARLGVDGFVYGHVDSTELHPLPEGHTWFRLQGFDRIPVNEADVAPSTYQGRGFSRIHQPTPSRWRVVDLDLADHRLVLADPEGNHRDVRLEYVSVGARLSPFTATPDGRIVGTTNHPLRLYAYDPDSAAVTDHGRSPVMGSIAPWATQGSVLIGSAYPGGHTYRLDPGKAIETGTNPELIAEVAEAYRPRCAVAHPDRRHVIWGGYGGYGDVGGALVCMRLDGGGVSDVPRVIKHSELAPHRAPTAIGVLPEGDLIVGTSVETPGGATPVERTAAVVRVAWPELTIMNHWQPIDEMRTWAGIAVARDGTVHLVSGSGWHVHLDPRTDEILARDDWSGHGDLALGGLVTTAEHAYVLQTSAVTRIDLEQHRVERLIEGTEAIDGFGPIRVGGAVIGSDLFVGSGSRMVRLRDV